MHEPVDRRFLLGGLAGAAGAAALAGLAKAGPLDPPAGSVAETGKTMQELYDKVVTTAGGGRTELNQTNTPGDAASHFIITQPGSYYLGASVTLPANKNGVRISASGVTVDLNGHSLITTNANAPLSSGVIADNATSQLCVRNGFVRGFGQCGVDLGNAQGGSVECVHAQDCATIGIKAPTNSRTRDCTAVNCLGVSGRGSGIEIPINGVIDSCSVINGGAGSGDRVGVRLGDRGRASNVHVSGYFGVGLKSGSYCTISDCFVLYCLDHGYSLNERTTLQRCTAMQNGHTTGGAGVFIASQFVVVSDCVILQNNIGILSGLVSGTDGVGMFVRNFIGHSVVYGMRLITTGNFIAHNVCNNNATNWSIVAGNRGGAVLNPTAGGAINGNSGLLTGTTDGWANITIFS